MSQTPPQKVAIGCENLGTPPNLERHSTASLSPRSDSIGLVKVSNSDDEDMRVQGHVIHCDTSANKNTTPEPSRGVLRIVDRLPRVPARPAISNSTPWAASTPGLAAAGRSDNAPVYRSPYVASEYEQRKSSHTGGSSDLSLHREVHGPAQMDWQTIARFSLPLLVPPDMLGCYMGSAPWVAQNGAAVPPRRAFMPFEHGGPPPHEDGSMSLSLKKAMSRSRHVSQSQPRAETMPPQANTDAEETQSAHQLPVQAGLLPPSYMARKNLPGPVLDDENMPDRGMSEGAGVRREVRIPRTPYKHAVTPPRTNAAKRPRDGFGPKEIDITDFKYRTIKAIEMPARGDLTPGKDPPEPISENLPYGDDIDYKLSMLMYWLDEKELTYSESARLYRQKFIGETDTDDTIRKKHHLTLIKLARRHGLRPEGELEEPGKNVLRRGKQTGHKYNTIGGRVVYAAGAGPGPDITGTARRKRVSEPSEHRGFLKACICVWKDTSEVGFEQIQQRLAAEYNWHVGVNTVQKLYYSERPRVYDTYRDTRNDVEEGPDIEETIEAVEGEDAGHVIQVEKVAEPSIAGTHGAS